MLETVPAGGAVAQQLLEVAVVCTSPVLTMGIGHLLEDWSHGITCHRLDLSDTHSCLPTLDLDVLILSPQSWEEMAAWVPIVRYSFSYCPWLLFTDPRIAGVFLPAVETHPCALVSIAAPPDQLRSAVRCAAAHGAAHPATELMALYDRGVVSHDSIRRPRAPTRVELQCGCAVSLGLGNRQVAKLLHLEESTVKSHLYRLGQKLGLANRQDLGAAIHHALIPLAAPCHGK